jgi:hypothetical protein
MRSMTRRSAIDSTKTAGMRSRRICWMMRAMPLRRGFGLRRDALGCDEVDAVGGLEMRKGVVRGDDLAPLRRDRGHRGADLGLEGVEFLEIRRRVGLVGSTALGIGGDEGIPDRADIELCVADVLPGMGIDPVPMPMGIGSFEGFVPFAASTTGAFVPEARMRRAIQPSKPRPFATTSRASARRRLSAGVGE